MDKHDFEPTTAKDFWRKGRCEWIAPEGYTCCETEEEHKTPQPV